MTQPLCLVGMSGTGKSHWAKRLAQRGYVRHDCDGEIATRLASVLPVGSGEPVHALGRWMGMPWTPGYAERQARYLELEEEVTRLALEASTHGGRHVIDTTGSVVYLSRGLLSELGRRSRVVYLAASAAQKAGLLQRYLRQPKPVVFGDAFSASPGETPEQALPRCFAALLDFREARYRAMAHLLLDAAALEATGVDGFLAML